MIGLAGRETRSRVALGPLVVLIVAAVTIALPTSDALGAAHRPGTGRPNAAPAVRPLAGPLPPGTGGNPAASLNSLSCTSIAYCIAVGDYEDLYGLPHGLIDTLAYGRWYGTAAPEPANAGTDGDNLQDGYLGAVSCTGPGSCAAVGQYTDTSDRSDGLIETLVGDHWSALEAPAPPASGGRLADLTAVSCGSPSECVAVGYFEDSRGFAYGLIDTLAGGHWTALEAPQPADAATDTDGRQLAFLGSIACPSGDACVAVGYYRDGSGEERALIETLSAGSWRAEPAPEPAGAGSDAAHDQGAELDAVTCRSVGSCAAVGDYEDDDRLTDGLIEALSDGRWTATQAPEPSSAGDDADGFQFAHLYSAACPSAATCTAVGYYADVNGYYYGLIDTLSGGGWKATEAPEPPGAGTDADMLQGAALGSVSCSGSTCLAVGDYGDDDAYTHGLVESGGGGSWVGTTAPQPAGAGNPGDGEESAQIAATWCDNVSQCVSVGYFRDSRGAYRALIEAPPLPPVPAAGYRLVAANGAIFAFHQSFVGSLPTLPRPGGGIGLHVDNIVAMAATPTGYLLVGHNGAVYAFHTAFHGSLVGRGRAVDDIVGIATTAGGLGYWLAGANGAVYPFGDARNLGSADDVGDIVGIASPDSGGYWLAGADGAVLAFGDAHPAGSCTSPHYGCSGVDDVVGIAAAGPDGYWLVSRGGGIFGFGRGVFLGSCPVAGSGCQGIGDADGIAPSGTDGYWITEADGTVVPFGSALFLGDESGAALARPISGIAS